MGTDNPFASPATEAGVPPEPVARFQVASQGQRFVNLFIDGILFRVLAFGAGMAIGIAYVVFGGDIDGDSETPFNLIGTITGLCVFFCYYVGAEYAFGRTPAKFLTGTRVIREDGLPPNLGQLAGRTLARLIPFEPFSFLTRSEPVGWHDALSGTRVIRER